MKTIKEYRFELDGELYLKKEDVLKLIDKRIKVAKRLNKALGNQGIRLTAVIKALEELKQRIKGEKN